ncbi:MAG: isocitrate lyase/PEP mutase family protein [Granulosicoccus sp.]|nr:isocitrate lyase/PEP mutase family protein [Granulosicoccus sp.]
MHWNKRRERFRQQIQSGRCIHPGSVFDPVSARMAEDIGFEVGMLAGSVASMTVLGDPDLILLTLSEFADQALRINRASSLPLMVDADHGYGNALNVRRTVEELETAGVSGLSIEDTLLPKSFGSRGSQLVSAEEGAAKMRAAVAARQDEKLFIAARTSAVSVEGVDEAIRRVAIYQETGVDAIFLIGVKEKEQLDLISQMCKLPIILGSGGTALQNLDYLSERGVAICLQGHTPIMAAYAAVYKTLLSLHSGAKPSEITGLPEKALIEKYTRAAEFAEMQSHYL